MRLRQRAGRRLVRIQPEARSCHIVLGVGEAQRPETDVMALARAVVDGLLETYVLPPSKEIEGAEGSGGIRRVE